MGRPKAERCKRGHFTTDGGRYANGNCIACGAGRVRLRDYKAERTARAKRNTDGLSLDKTYIDAEPLVHWVIGGRQRLNAQILDRFASQRYRNDGRITALLADEICAALGEPTAYILGPEWDQQVSA